LSFHLNFISMDELYVSSWNTNQGVYEQSEVYLIKQVTEMKVYLEHN